MCLNDQCQSCQLSKTSFSRHIFNANQHVDTVCCLGDVDIPFILQFAVVSVDDSF
jgi:hypothetical protein